MKNVFFAAIALSIVLAGIVPAHAACDLRAAAKNFYKLRTWEAHLTTRGQMMTLDFQAPDRYAEKMSNGTAMTFIGNGGWMQIGGRSIAVPPMATSTFTTNTQSIRTMGLNGTVLNKFKITSIGPCAYHLVDTTNSTYTVDMYLNNANLPVKAVTHTSHGPVTVTYSRFNDPAIRITAP